MLVVSHYDRIPGGRRSRLVILIVTLSLLAAEETEAERLYFFEKKIRPVLVSRCYSCHSSETEELRGGLELDTQAGTRRGGDSGHAVVPGDPGASRLLSTLRRQDPGMLPEHKLPESVIASFEKWILRGAFDPRDGQGSLPARTPPDVEPARDLWAFQRPGRHPSPAVRNKTWSRQPVDGFILSRLEKADREPNGTASPVNLIRRVSFGLTGLPPTPAEVEAFVRDRTPDAYERLVERLLASPHFGERFARMWLDVARYGEDQAHIVGNNKSLLYPNAYLYRDWVIQSLNQDLPYDRFIELQLAADLLEPESTANLAALGFLGLGPKYYRRSDPAVQADEWEDRVDTVSRGLLGLTVACARCHNHKFDPISTEDYHALAGVFASTEMYNRPLDGDRAKKDDGQAKLPEDSMHIVRDGEARDLNVFLRGDVNDKGPLVRRRFIQILSPGSPALFQNGSGRLDLARAITGRENPLTARVLVNRVWALLFGRGLVATPSNFGTMGQPPTHPELLDDLATRFMDSGWSIKYLVRELVLSATYRQSSKTDSRRLSVDPDNLLWSRMVRRRLDVESWRDALLSVSGRLEFRLGGESMDPQDPDSRRRTVYSQVSRFDLNPLLALFDFPDPNVHAARRVETTTPLQKLFVLNSPFMVRQALSLGERLRETGEKSEARIERAYLLLYGRPAREVEIHLGLRFLEGGEVEARWRQYAQVLLASSEMLFVD